jgi:hypothetical protein
MKDPSSVTESNGALAATIVPKCQAPFEARQGLSPKRVLFSTAKQHSDEVKVSMWLHQSVFRVKFGIITRF